MMKKVFLLALVATMIAACQQNPASLLPDKPQKIDYPVVIMAGGKGTSKHRDCVYANEDNHEHDRRQAAGTAFGLRIAAADRKPVSAGL